MKKAGAVSLGLGGVLAAALSLPALAFASPAGAAGYPPPTLPASCSSTGGVLVVNDTGSESITLNAPGSYKPGTPVSIIYNGVTMTTVTVPASGVITLTFTTDPGPEISVDGSPLQPAVYGTNTIDANGVDSTGGADGTLSCPFLITLDPGGHTVVTTTTTTTGVDDHDGRDHHYSWWRDIRRHSRAAPRAAPTAPVARSPAARDPVGSSPPPAHRRPPPREHWPSPVLTSKR